MQLYYRLRNNSEQKTTTVACTDVISSACLKTYQEVCAESGEPLTLLEDSNAMLNDSDLATLRNRFRKDAEFLMQTTTSSDEDEKSKLVNISC